jgi:hypothetical protein
MGSFVKTTMVFPLKKNEQNGKKGIDHPPSSTITSSRIACGNSFSS